MDEIEGLTTRGRETGVRKLMATNLLKRFESSVHSFRVTLKRVYGYMDDTVKVIDKYEQHRAEHKSLGMFDRIDADVFDEGFDLDRDDAEEIEFTTQGKTQFALSDMDWKSWRSYIQADMRVIEGLLAMIRDIDPEHDAKLQRLYQTIRDKQERPINEGNRRILVFTAFADTADYLYEHVSEYAQPLGLETAEVTGSRPGRCTVKKVGGDMGDILACFSPESKERGVTDPGLSDCDIDILIATDCISEGQNLQDCDMMVNYDIHWNPVRIVQRFGRVDRIGSTNQRIQLVNYWPDMDLDKYLRLKDRVEARMRLTVMTSTGDDDYINENEHGDLAYREKQLKQMQTEIPDLEDVEGGISITDLGLNEFRMDLVEYHKKNPDIKHVPHRHQRHRAGNGSRHPVRIEEREQRRQHRRQKPDSPLLPRVRERRRAGGVRASGAQGVPQPDALPVQGQNTIRSCAPRTTRPRATARTCATPPQCWRRQWAASSSRTSGRRWTAFSATG